MSFLSIDLGSSRCKAVVFSAEGKVVAQQAAAYSPEFPEPSFAEMAPEKFFQAVCNLSRAVARDASRDPIRALCLSSHGETFIPAGPSGEALGSAILNMDNRAALEAAWLEKSLGRRRLFEITGLVVHPMYPVPKILWLRKHRPELFRDRPRFLSVTDYILARLGFQACIDYSLASRFLAFDVRQRHWSAEILRAAELDADQLPTPVLAGTVAGKLGAKAADQLGVPSGALVVIGGHDQPCAALGVGAIEKGRVSDSMGTYECLLAVADEPSIGEDSLRASLNSSCHVVANKFAVLAYFPSGIMVQWFCDLLRSFRAAQGDAQGAATEEQIYAALESSAPSEPTGLCITPHLIGTCNPDFNPRARAAMYGLDAGTDPSQIYRGILEGIACEFAQIADPISEAAGAFQDVYVTGGGCRSRLGLQLRAALGNRRLHVMQCQEAVCLGGAILAAVAAGEYSDVAEAVKQLVRESAVAEPDAGLAAKYAHQMKRYRMLYSALAPLRDASS